MVNKLLTNIDVVSGGSGSAGRILNHVSEITFRGFSSSGAFGTLSTTRRVARRHSIERIKCAANGRKHPFDLGFGDDQRRRDDQRVAAAANQDAFVEAAVGACRAARFVGQMLPALRDRAERSRRMSDGARS